jgi:NAD(P)-dependent dehydrogenase (short-subunit alcohol dehydrogenase family)
MVESCMALMLGGTYLMTSLLIPALKKSNDPRVINVSSGGAYTLSMNI